MEVMIKDIRALRGFLISSLPPVSKTFVNDIILDLLRIHMRKHIAGEIFEKCPVSGKDEPLFEVPDAEDTHDLFASRVYGIYIESHVPITEKQFDILFDRVDFMLGEIYNAISEARNMVIDISIDNNLLVLKKLGTPQHIRFNRLLDEKTKDLNKLTEDEKFVKEK
jgi:hypothetical protein